MTYKKNNKEFIYYILYNLGVGSFVNIFLLAIVVGTKKDNVNLKCRRALIVTYLVYIIGFFDIFVIVTSFSRYFNKLPKNTDFPYYYKWNMVFYSSIKVLWVNFFSQQKAKDFLNYTGLFSLGNVIYGIVSIIFIDKLEYSMNTLMIIQLISAFICIIILVIMIVIFFYKDKYFNIIDEN